jgi:hypothetical protein
VRVKGQAEAPQEIAVFDPDDHVAKKPDRVHRSDGRE